jgi:AraC-like DNA-binding protein
MFLRQYQPRPELQHFIRRIMVSYFHHDNSSIKTSNPFPPQPEHCLYFYPWDKVTCRNYANGFIEEVPHSIIVGPQLSRVDLTMGNNMMVIMVGFHPGGMHRLLHIPMHELLGRPIDSTLILGNIINEILEQLNATSDPDKMVDIIQLYLVKKASHLKRSLPIEDVLKKIIQSKDFLSVDQLAKGAYVSNRQLERQFKERTGMPPKTFMRLLRFSRAWIHREKNPGDSWFEIAHKCNYADQMHMIRDFKDFVGVTPGYLQHQLELNPLRLQASTFD